MTDFTTKKHESRRQNTVQLGVMQNDLNGKEEHGCFTKTLWRYSWVKHGTKQAMHLYYPVKFWHSAAFRLLHLSQYLTKGNVMHNITPNKMMIETITYLVGGWTNLFEKYARQDGFIFPNFRSENKKYWRNPPPSYSRSLGITPPKTR